MIVHVGGSLADQQGTGPEVKAYGELSFDPAVGLPALKSSRHETPSFGRGALRM